MYSEEELLKELERVSEEYCDGEVPEIKDMEDYGKFSSSTYAYRFDSWNKSLQNAGFEPNVTIQGDISKSELLDEIKRLSENLEEGYVTKRYVDEKGKYSSGLYRNKFGTWTNALVEAGINKEKIYGHITMDFYDLVYCVKEEYDHFPNYKLYKRNECSIDDREINHHIQSWKVFMEENIIEKTWEEYHKDVFLCDLERVRKELEQESISIADYKRFDGACHSYAKVYRLFNNWYNALEELGLPEKENPMMNVSGEEHPCYIHGESDSISYGSSWTDKLKEQVRERDNWSCRVCGKSNEQNEEENKSQLHIHHIKPHWTWDISKEHQEMNDKDNLVTLCHSCHGKLEGKWKDTQPDEFARRGKELLGYVEDKNERTLFAY